MNTPSVPVPGANKRWVSRDKHQRMGSQHANGRPLSRLECRGIRSEPLALPNMDATAPLWHRWRWPQISPATIGASSTRN